jgi:LacI family transcriptional regulator
MKHAPRVIVAISTVQGWGRDCLRGAITFMRNNRAWDCRFCLMQDSVDQAIQTASAAEGMIIDARLVTPPVRRLKLPVVVAGDELRPGFHQVRSDPTALGQLAARHLLERGLTHFAYYAFDGQPFARLKGEAFKQELKSKGYDCAWLEVKIAGAPGSWWKSRKELVTWVKKLPRPVGIFCTWDPVARTVAVACREAKIDVPREVAILGVNNDELQCGLFSPQLSSIDGGAQRVGFEAAHLLQRLMDGEKVAKSVTEVQPLRVVVRESTDILAVPDANIAAATRHIQQELSTGVNVKQIVQRLGIGRRTLEVAFRTHLGRTVHDEIIRLQLERATHLLSDGHLSLADVAMECGFGYQSRMGNFFKKHTGMTPLEYRRAHQRKYF